MAAEDPSIRSDFYVYALFRENGVPFYIGKGRGDRWLQHEQEAERHSSNSHKCRLIRSAKARGFEVIKVKLHEGLTEIDANACEIAFIKAIGRGDRGPLVNRTDGGEGTTGYRYSPERAAKRGESRRGEKQSPEHIAKRTAAHLGKKRSPEACENISAAKRGKPVSPITILAASRATLGKAKTPEHRAKISAANLGKPKTAEHRAKLAAANRGKKQSPEYIAKTVAGRLAAKLRRDGTLTAAV